MWSWLDPYRLVDERFARARTFGAACAFVVLALMTAGAALLFAVPGYVGGTFLMRVGAAAAAFVVGFLLAAAVATLRGSSVWSESGTRLHRRFLVTFLGGGVLAGLALTAGLPVLGRALNACEPDLTLFFKRTVNVTSGFSPAPGALLYSLTLVAATLSELGRIRLLDFAARFEREVFPLTTATKHDVAIDRVVKTGLRGPLFVLAASAVGVLVTCRSYHQPFEGRWLGDLFCLAGPYLVAAMIVFQLFRFVRTWTAMRRAFHAHLDSKNLPSFRKRLQPFFLRLLRPPLDPALARTVVEACAPVAGLPKGDPHREAVWLVVFASYGRAHLHNFLTFVSAAGFLLAFLSTTYPFKLFHAADILTWIVLIAAIVTALFVLIQMNRSEILSRIAGTTPGHVSLDRTFFRTILIHVGIPLLGIAATRFTTVRVLFEEFGKPLMQLFGGIGAD